VSLTARLHFVCDSCMNWFLVQCFSAGSDGVFTRTPESTTFVPLLETLLRLNCGTDQVAPVLWTFTAEGSTSRTDMTGAGVLLPAFRPYFFIVSSFKYDLVARTSNANESYCGTYTCVENNGFGASRTATVASKCAIGLGLYCVRMCLHIVSKTE